MGTHLFLRNVLQTLDSGERYIPFSLRGLVTERIVQDYVKNTSFAVEALARGLSDVLPLHYLSLFTPSELEVLMCGDANIDIELLKRATVYENIQPDEDRIKYFWKALEEMSQEDRSKFINFCCARSRLPSSVDRFPMSFKIQ